MLFIRYEWLRTRRSRPLDKCVHWICSDDNSNPVTLMICLHAVHDQIASLQVQMAGLQTLLDSSYVIHLEAGWNLVSLGKEAQEHDVTDILGNAHSGAVWTWQDGRFQTTTTMQSQKGYWIYAVEQAEIEVQLP